VVIQGAIAAAARLALPDSSCLLSSQCSDIRVIIHKTIRDSDEIDRKVQHALLHVLCPCLLKEYVFKENALNCPRNYKAAARPLISLLSLTTCDSGWMLLRKVIVQRGLHPPLLLLGENTIEIQ